MKQPALPARIFHDPCIIIIIVCVLTAHDLGLRTSTTSLVRGSRYKRGEQPQRKRERRIDGDGGKGMREGGGERRARDKNKNKRFAPSRRDDLKGLPPLTQAG